MRHSPDMLQPVEFAVPNGMRVRADVMVSARNPYEYTVHVTAHDVAFTQVPPAGLGILAVKGLREDQLRRVAALKESIKRRWRR